MDDEKALRDGLDPVIRTEVNRILAKDVNDLSIADKMFLRARAGYIKDKHKERLANIFSASQAKEDQTTREEIIAQTEHESNLAEIKDAEARNPFEPLTVEDDGPDEN